MKKHILLSLTLVAVSAAASAAETITDVEQLSNSTAYTIERVAYTYNGLIYASGSSVKLNGESTASGDNYLWSIYHSKATGEYYLYNLGAKQFFQGSEDNAAVLVDTPTEYLTPIYNDVLGYWMFDCGGSLLGLNTIFNGAVIFSDDETSSTGRTKGYMLTITPSTRTVTAAEQQAIEAQIIGGAQDVYDVYRTFVAQSKAMLADGLTHYAGAYDVTELEYALEHTDKYSLADIEAIYRSALLSRLPKANAFYRLHNYKRPVSGSMDNVLSVLANDNVSSRTLADPAVGAATAGYQENLSLFTFSYPASDAYTVNVGWAAGGLAFGTVTMNNNTSVQLVPPSADHAYTLEPQGEFSRLFTLAEPAGGWLTVGGNNVLVGYTQAEDPEKFYLEEVKELSVKPNTNGHLLLQLPCPVALPEVVVAYTVTGVDGNEASLRKIDSEVIPADFPFLLHSSNGAAEVHLSIADSNPVLAVENILSGTNVAVTADAPARYHLGSAVGASGMPEFVRTTASTIAPNNAWFVTSTTGAISSKLEDTTTLEISIEDIDLNHEWYDLQGRRVLSPSIGLYLNGTTRSKVLIK